MNFSPKPRHLTPGFFAVEWDSGCTQLTIFLEEKGDRGLGVRSPSS
ncbi:hypothetical protein [uncultured Nostoc sp.]